LFYLSDKKLSLFIACPFATDPLSFKDDAGGDALLAQSEEFLKTRGSDAIDSFLFDSKE
jgi:hypothetical protein